MPEYNDRTQTFISKDDFFQMNRMDIIYTGYVEGLGYAFEEQIYIDESLYRQNGDNFFHSKSIQRIDYSPESYIRSLHLTEGQIKNAICFSNPDGTFSVNMGFNAFGKRIVKVSNLDDVKVLLNYNCVPATLTVKVIERISDNCKTEEYTIPLKDFNIHYGSQLTSDILQTFDMVNAFIGTPVAWLESKWNIENVSNRRFRRDLSNEISKSLRNNGYNIKSSTIRKSLGKFLNRAGRVGSVLSTLSTAANMFNNKNVKVSDVYTVVTGLCATIPGVGWAIGGVFFAADIVGLCFFDKTIGDMIDEELDGGVLWGNDYEVDPIQNIDPIQNKEELNFCTDFYNSFFVMPQDNTKVVSPFIYRK